MAIYEIRDQYNLAVRVDAAGPQDALELAVALAPELDEGSLYLATDPVGADGEDAP